ncbi:MAG: hypothetical protein ACJ8FY_28740 [Gemmataceae bacterium]
MERHASIAFTVLGVVFLVLAVAGFFGLNDKVTLSAKEMRTVKAEDSEVEFRQPSFTSVGAVPGFAIASGLCLLAAAVANRWGKSVVYNPREQDLQARSGPMSAPKLAPDRDLWEPPEFPADDL